MLTLAIFAGGSEFCSHREEVSIYEEQRTLTSTLLDFIVVVVAGNGNTMMMS